ncbi:ABC transporter permease [Leptolyngbya sp. FACHB-17]|uniref:ABC transporter permease n=1 Tax=unclassified Leptolyngbya TaxID=2650499 RepID=UPI00168108E9|nr:ABC transporter permease [Leptolyngbya sp. FACHB-17]MBD2079346.1 ABC transporter permease [Leptolyngbya sp. FACHB-17]
MALSPLDLAFTALRDLSSNWVRSSLTALGIFMGVTAVNAILNIDAISTTLIQQKLDARDNPFFTVWVYDADKTKPAPELKEEDLAQLKREVSGIKDISRVNWIKASQVQYLGKLVSGLEILGVSKNYQRTTGRRILQGRFFEPSDFTNYHPVAIIDKVLAKELFGPKKPIGEGIFLDGSRLLVIGVSESKNNWGKEKPSGTLWVPETYGHLIQGKITSGSPQIALSQLDSYQAVQQQAEAVLTKRYPNFSIYFMGNAEDLYKEDQQQRKSIQMLKVVGLLALVTGGVGIANITVAAVVERTREIGLRRAIGATNFEVILQFITEAVFLSFIGGITAIVTVHFLTEAATKNLFEVPYQFQFRNAAVSMVAALVVGVGSSFLPALRVSQIDVVQALQGD